MTCLALLRAHGYISQQLAEAYITLRGFLEDEETSAETVEALHAWSAEPYGKKKVEETSSIFEHEVNYRRFTESDIPFSDGDAWECLTELLDVSALPPHQELLIALAHLRARVFRLTSEEESLIRRHEAFYRQLMDGTQGLDNETRRHFVQVMKGELPPLTDHERAYLKHLILQKEVRSLAPSTAN
jgi:hypothetical protein